MNLCADWKEIKGKPGHWICPHCKIPRGGAKGQRRPSPYPKNLRRECKPVGEAKVPKAPRDRLKPKSRGLGDTVAKAIEVATFGLVKKKSGCGCDKRQQWLNEKFPYRDDADERGSAAG